MQAPLAQEPQVSEIQREREEMLTIYESPSSLPVPLFAKLAGKSKDQVNRELKAGKLLSISIGNRGQRVPDWQLVPLKLKLAQVMLSRVTQADAWELYYLLTKPTQGCMIGRPSISSRRRTLTRSCRHCLMCLNSPPRLLTSRASSQSPFAKA